MGLTVRKAATTLVLAGALVLTNAAEAKTLLRSQYSSSNAASSADTTIYENFLKKMLEKVPSHNGKIKGAEQHYQVLYGDNIKGRKFTYGNGVLLINVVTLKNEYLEGSVNHKRIKVEYVLSISRCDVMSGNCLDPIIYIPTGRNYYAIQIKLGHFPFSHKMLVLLPTNMVRFNPHELIIVKDQKPVKKEQQKEQETSKE